MVARSAPSRPIRVTVSFANRLDHRCFAYLRVGGRVRLRICKARRQKAAGWTSREEEDQLRPPRASRARIKPGRGFRTSRTPRPSLGRPAVRPFREPLVPPSIGKYGADCGAVSSPCGLRAAPPPCQLDFPIAGPPSGPRREAVRQVRGALRFPPLPDRPIFNRGDGKAHR